MKKYTDIHFPAIRMRRTRRSNSLRRLVEETNLSVNDLIYPTFVMEGKNQHEPIKSMPGIYRQSIDGITETAEKLMSLNIPAIAIFPIIEEEKKSHDGKEAYNSKGLIQKTIKHIKSKFPELTIITDVALDPYTTHGQDGIIDENNYVLNDITVEILTKQAMSHAEAGTDIVAPSDMMDGRIGSIRNA
ncbi:MAG: porphobilinogen synthase, partial [Pseudomonadota bacterium]|nr:porphobilinogen synthase [Pseudomonadota bacterium]